MRCPQAWRAARAARAALSTLLLVALTLLGTLMPGPAWADELVDLSRTSTLSLSYVHQGEPVEGMTVRIFRVGDMYAAGDFALAGAFAPCAGEVSANRSQTSAQWLQQAYILADYAMNEGIRPGWELETPASGALDVEGLPTGLYLVVSDPLTVTGETEEVVYTTQPTLLSLPTTAGGGWSYGVFVRPKLARQTSTRSISVTKLWVDEGHETARPESLQVTLLCDGSVYDTVILSAGNDWHYEWTVLSRSCIWTIREEEVPEGYTASVRHAGDDLVLVNTYVPSTPNDPDTPDVPDTPDRPDTPSTPSTPSTPDAPGTPDAPTTPDAPGTPEDPTPNTPQLETPPAPEPVPPSDALEAPAPQGAVPQMGDTAVTGVALALAIAGVALMVRGWRLGKDAR